jgi:hypothetical protein
MCWVSPYACSNCMYVFTCVRCTHVSVLVLREEEVEEKDVAVRSEGS